MVIHTACDIDQSYTLITPLAAARDESPGQPVIEINLD
jgi:hypothetical protein